MGGILAVGLEGGKVLAVGLAWGGVLAVGLEGEGVQDPIEPKLSSLPTETFKLIRFRGKLI